MIETPCILWWGPMDTSGYGTVRRRWHRELAHRMVYRECFGAIPDGYVVHHECGNRACVNPEHLTSMPFGAHSRLHYGVHASNERRRAATRCAYGHAFTAENTRVRRNGSRVCRECAARRTREYRERLAA